MNREAAVKFANYAELMPGTGQDNGIVASCMLLWCRGGSGRVTVNGAVLPLHPGDWLYLPWLHRIAYANGAGGVWRLGGIHFGPEGEGEEFAVRHHCEAEGLEVAPGAAPYLRRGRLSGMPGWELLLDYTVELFQSGRFDAEAARALAGLLRREIAAAGEVQPLSPLLAGVLARLEARLGEPVSIGDMVRWSGYSRATLFRLFREELAVTPLGWLTARRLAQAARWLRESDAPLKEVARRAGFADADYFARCFRRGYGETPGAYRRGRRWR